MKKPRLLLPAPLGPQWRCPPGSQRPRSDRAQWTVSTRSSGNKRLLIWLIGTAGGWLLLDFCYYGNTISSPEILKLINPSGTLLDNTLTQLAIFAVFALPGYAVAILLLDKTGRKTIQVMGFTMMALMFLLLGLIPGVTKDVVPFLLLYGVSYFFTEFGPNTTTFIYPAELFRPRSGPPAMAYRREPASWAPSPAPSCSLTFSPPPSA